MKKYIVLPGLDGTGLLCARFAAIVSTTAECAVVQYPSSCETVATCAEIAVESILKQPDACVIAESFSGAVLINLLARGVVPSRIVFVATFGSTPTPLLAAFASFAPAWSASIALRSTLEYFCLNGVGEEFVLEARQVVEFIPHDTIQSRLRSLAQWKAFKPAQLPKDVLIINAAHDRLVGTGPKRALGLQFPMARVVNLPGPHFMLHAKSAECWNEISAFANGA